MLAEKVIKEVGGPKDDREPGTADSRIRPQLFYASKDSEGKPVAGEALWGFRETSKRYNLDSEERASINFETRLRRLAAQRGLPDEVARRATEIYYRVREAAIFTKPNLNDLALALIMAACRDIRYVTTYEDLVGRAEDSGRITNINHMFVRSGAEYRRSIAGVLGWRTPKWFGVEDFVTYYSGKLGIALNGETIRQARDVIARNHRSYRDPHANPSAPHVHAAAALFIALRKAHVDISQHDYCQKVNLSEISLRGHVKELGGYGPTEVTAVKVNSSDPGLDDC